jgi:hypothetical protein
LYHHDTDSGDFDKKLDANLDGRPADREDNDDDEDESCHPPLVPEGLAGDLVSDWAAVIKLF